MIPIEINLTAESINKAVADAIVTSVIGEEIKKGVRTIVEREIRSHIETIIANQFLPLIQEKVAEACTPDVVGMLAEKMIRRIKEES
jgi:hypothetical protein